MVCVVDESVGARLQQGTNVYLTCRHMVRWMNVLLQGTPVLDRVHVRDMPTMMSQRWRVEQACRPVSEPKPIGCRLDAASSVRVPLPRTALRLR